MSHDQTNPEARCEIITRCCHSCDALQKQVETLTRERDESRGDPNKPAIVVDLGGKYHLVGVADDVPPTKWKPYTDADAKEVAELLTKERDALQARVRELEAITGSEVDRNTLKLMSLSSDAAYKMEKDRADALQDRLAAMTALVQDIHDGPGI